MQDCQLTEYRAHCNLITNAIALSKKNLVTELLENNNCYAFHKEDIDGFIMIAENINLQRSEAHHRSRLQVLKLFMTGGLLFTARTVSDFSHGIDIESKHMLAYLFNSLFNFSAIGALSWTSYTELVECLSFKNQASKEILNLIQKFKEKSQQQQLEIVVLDD